MYATLALFTLFFAGVYHAKGMAEKIDNKPIKKRPLYCARVERPAAARAQRMPSIAAETIPPA